MFHVEHAMTKQFLARSAYNKNFGTGPGEVPSNDDGRWNETITVDAFLLLAEQNQLVPGKLYWVTDATEDYPLWAYAVSGHDFEVIQPARMMVTDVDMAGNALRASEAGAVIGSLKVFTDAIGSAISLIGSSKLNPQDVNDLDEEVIVAGSRVSVSGPQIQLHLPGAEVGGTLVISAVDGDMATIAAVPPVPPAYSVAASNASDVPLVVDGATETVLVLGGAPDFPTTQAFAAGDSWRFGAQVDNSAGVGGATVEVGFQIEDAAVPGVWSGPNIWMSHLAVAGGSSLFTQQGLLVAGIAANSNIRMIARATGVAMETELGDWDYSGRSMGPVVDGGFVVDSQKPVSTTQFRLAKVNNAGQDVGAWLLDLVTGPGMLRTNRSAGETVYALNTVTDETGSVLLDVSNGTGNNSNWSGFVVFTGTLSSGGAVITIRGTIYAQNFVVFEQ